VDYTEEQLAIADAQVGVNSWLKIIARAGTGKTSSFIAYARQNVVPTLYLAFNKSVEESARGKFPSHVTCKTVHALAWGAVGRRYPNLSNSVRYYEVQKLYRLDVYASTLVCKTLDNFLNSADPKMGLKHAEEDHRKKFKTDIRATLVECANDLWARMCAGDQEKFQMTHSGYLKLYQLSKPHLFQKTILLDEGQDTNPVTFDIVEQQRKLGARILICGDHYQAIYSWRGAKNALDFVQDTETLFLTQSFRFGEQVARVANSILTSFFHEEVLVQGHPLIYDEIVSEFPDSEPVTVIARTNAEIFDQAASWTGRGKSVHFIGEAKFNLLVDGVMDVYHMFMNTRGAIRDKTIAFHRDFACLKLFAEERMDNELLSKINIVEKHKVGVPRLIEQIKKLTVPEPMANIVLVTAHKSKGLEWDNVYLTNDYFELFSKETGGLKLLREEVEAKIAAGHYDHGDDDYDELPAGTARLADGKAATERT
jgi:F-box protein 18 (helicase)